MREKARKILFNIVVLANMIMVLIYQFLTPNMSDDVIYMDKVATARNFFDLFTQEYEHYMGHTGRSIAHIILRIFLYIDVKAVFNIAASAVFILLSFLIYINIDYRKKYDIRIYSAIAVLQWLFDPTIGDTVFWETGACNYLFTTAIIMGYITLFRKAAAFEKGGEKKKINYAVLMFFMGLLAGWCNENTSGGVILFVILMFVGAYLEKKDFSFVSPWMISGFAGNVIGFLIMILSPGNFGRAQIADEEHTGVMALFARFLKITINIKESYLILVLTFVVIMIAVAYKNGSVNTYYSVAKSMILFGILFLATDYALIMVPASQLRTYFGASVFLMIAILNGFAFLSNKVRDDGILQILSTSLITCLGLVLIFTYIQQGANLARIKREVDERNAYYVQMKEADEMTIEAPMLRPDWQCRYSIAYKADISEDKFNWLNLAYAEHYGIHYIIGVDRESWTAY